MSIAINETSKQKLMDTTRFGVWELLQVLSSLLTKKNLDTVKQAANHIGAVPTAITPMATAVAANVNI